MLRLILKLVCLVLGAILGVTACHHGDEYGVPYARFKLDGKVVVTKTKAPLQGISVCLETMGNARSQPTSTDAAGQWAIDTRQAGGSPSAPVIGYRLKVSDSDGPANGGDFRDTWHPVALQQTSPRSGWDYGVYEAHDVLIELQEWRLPPDAGAADRAADRARDRGAARDRGTDRAPSPDGRRGDRGD